MSDEPCELVPWDSEFFGLTIARVNAKEMTPLLSREINRWCDAHDVRCLYLMLDPADGFPSIAVAERSGYRLVDVKVLMVHADHAIAGTRPPSVDSRIRQAIDSDVPVLEEIATRSHGRDGRFSHDGHFPIEKCEELYRIWIRQSVTGGKDHVLVADVDGQVAGYCACAFSPDGRTGKISLIAVDERFRGRGIGDDLVNASLGCFASREHARVELVTQAYNVAAQRMYQRCGFVTRGCVLNYHKWFDRGDGRR